MKGLFINSRAKKCSIYESGQMIYKCLLKAKSCEFDYVEIDQNNREIPTGYDLYFINYHYLTMSWLNVKKLKKDFGFIMTVVLEVLPNDPFPLVDKNAFDIYCVIDPTINIKNKNVFTFTRPLEPFETTEKQLEHTIPTIGSFGLPTSGKGFAKIVQAVNQEFDKALIKINIPTGNFTIESEKTIEEYKQKCIAAAKDGINIEFSHDFMDKEELINWCAQNTINCFFYDRNQPGLSATTDQAISSERPLLVSDNETFRHITQYIKPYPECSIKEAIKTTEPIVKQIKQDWSQEAFAAKFDEMIKEIETLSQKTKLRDYNNLYKLPINPEGLKHKLIRKIVNTKKFQRWHREYTNKVE